METPEAKIKKALDALIKEVKPIIFTNSANATDDETLGIIVSKYVEWEGERIKDIASYAFEDANYHGLKYGHVKH